MKVNILCSIDKRPSAMNRQLLEFGNYLYSKWHNISVIRPIIRQYPKNKREAIEIKLGELAHLISGRRIRTIKNLPWIYIKCPVKVIPSIQERYLGFADIVFFSMCPSPLIKKLPEGCGKKVMQVCSIWLAENTNFIPPEDIYLLTNSSLMKKLLEERIKREVFLLVNSVNTKIFNSPSQREIIQTIGMFFYNKKPEHKGMEDGFWVMEQLHKIYPSLEFQVVGEWKENYIPPFVKFIDGKKIDNLVNFYRSTDILLFPGKKDACPNPPMEAMASRCAVVTTEVGGISDYTVRGKTAIVVQPGDREGLLEGTITLLKNNDYFRKISEGGYKKIQEFNVERQGEKLEKYLLNLIR